MWTAECADPSFVDEDFCGQVNIAGMTGEGRTLYVPTVLSPQDRNRAQEACQPLAFAHFDTEGIDFGYELIGILDSFGGTIWVCEVSPN